MILQALTQLYEVLSKAGEIPRPGWVMTRVSYAIEINRDGKVLSVLPLKFLSGDGKKMVPRTMSLPAPVKRTVGKVSNFLWDNANYFLALDTKGDKEHAMKCFEEAKRLHAELLSDCKNGFALAILKFFATWDARNAENCVLLANASEDLAKGENVTFMYEGRFAADDSELCSAWQRHFDCEEEGEKLRCLISGESTVPVAVHPTIKGVRNAQSAGAALVAFNADAFCSYNREQSLNAPISKYAAFAYTAALNYLIAQRNADGKPMAKQIGDTTTVFWAEDAQEQYQNAFSAVLDGDGGDVVTASSLEGFLKAIARGENADWDGFPIKPKNRFYVLGLAPNAARLSVRFFLQDNFGNMAQNIQEHYNRLEIVPDGRSKWNTLPLWALLQETVNKKSKDKTPNPQMAGDTIRAILTNGMYPSTLYQQTQLRIRAERDITWGRASIIKAYLIKNIKSDIYKEVLTVKLNEQATFQPYVLGRLFFVLEAIQLRANPGINTTIKDKYFSSACATPMVVFPILLRLAEVHLKKMDTGTKVYYSKQLGELTQMITESYPAHQTLNEQGIFQLGYYHQTQKRYEKKNNNIEEEK